MTNIRIPAVMRERTARVYTLPNQWIQVGLRDGVALGSLATASASVWGLWAGGKYGGESEGEYGGGEVGGHGRYLRCRLS